MPRGLRWKRANDWLHKSAVERYPYRARWYDPEIGRFLTRDPIGDRFDDHSVAAFLGNTYEYALDNPVVFRDPSGLVSVPEIRVCVLNGLGWGGNITPCALSWLCSLEGKLTNASTEGDGNANAQQHCVWSCCMAKAVGQGAAEAYGTAHENGTAGTGGTPCDTASDQWNNRAGRELASRGSSCRKNCAGLRCLDRRFPNRPCP